MNGSIHDFHIPATNLETTLHDGRDRVGFAAVALTALTRINRTTTAGGGTGADPAATAAPAGASAGDDSYGSFMRVEALLAQQSADGFADEVDEEE